MSSRTEVYYPSCSELIATVAANNIDDIKNVLREIERVTGWKVGIRYETSNNKPKNERDRLIQHFEPINIDRLSISLDEECDGHLAVSNPPHAECGIDVTITNSHKALKDKGIGSIDDVGVVYSAEEGGLTFICGDYETQLFPVLAKLHQTFGVDVRTGGGGGGSWAWFEHWSAMHGLIPKDDYNTQCTFDSETGECYCQSALPINLKEDKHKVGKKSGLIIPSSKDWRDMLGK